MDALKLFRRSQPRDDDGNDDLTLHSGVDEEQAGQVRTPQRFTPTLTAKQIRDNRTFMTMANYMLNYPRWSISIFLLLAGWTLPLPLAEQAVRQPIRDLRVITSEEAGLYYECMVDAFVHIQARANATVLAEQARVAEIQANNQILVQKARPVADLAVNVSRSAQGALQTWQTQRPIPLINDTAICDAYDLSNFLNLIGSPEESRQNEVYDIVGNYIQQSQSSLALVVNYTQARSTYDYNYFVGVKIQGAILTMNNFNVSALTLTFPETDILQKLLALLQPILDALRNAYVEIQLLSARLNEFFVSIQGFYVNYLDIYGRLELAGSFVADFLPPLVPLPSMFDLSAVPTADFLLPQIFEIPQFSIELPAVDDLLAEYIRQALILLGELVLQLAEEATQKAREIVLALIQALEELLTLKDYHPPHFVGLQGGSLSDEQDHLNQLGDQTMQGTSAALNRTPAVKEVTDLSETSIPDLNLTSSSSVGFNSTTFGYLDSVFPSLTIPDALMWLFHWIANHQWIIEIVVQFIRLWRLKRKYEKASTPDLPEIDFGSKEEEEEDESKPGTITLLQVAVLKHFLTPWMALGLVLFPLAIIAVALWFPYVKANCIDSRSGTFVAKGFLTPLLVNSANAPGFSYRAAAEASCSRAQQVICNQMAANADYIYRSDRLALLTAQSRFNRSLQVMEVLRPCPDVEQLDAEFEASCCGLQGYGTSCWAGQDKALCPIDNSTTPPSSYRPVGEYLGNPVFSSDLASWQLGDSQFNCKVLQGICNAVPCSGVDEHYLQQMTIAADCMVEVYIIQCCVFVLVALYHGVLVNLYCTLAFSAVKHLRWRSLKPDGIPLRAQMREDGTLVKGDSQDERIARIAKAMRRFELVGRLQLCLAVCLFVFWFVTFIILHQILVDLKVHQ